MQTYSNKQMRQRILDACSHSRSLTQQPADALLLLSGSHPLRNLPWTDRQGNLLYTLYFVSQMLDPAEHSGKESVVQLLEQFYQSPRSQSCLARCTICPPGTGG